MIAFPTESSITQVRIGSSANSKARMNNTNHFKSSRKTKKKGYFVGFYQLVQKLK